MPVKPERVKPSGHDEAAVLKPKPSLKLYRLLIARHLYPPPQGQDGNRRIICAYNTH